VKMICAMALFDSELREELFLILELSNLKQYTHFVGLHGSSDFGKKEGTVAWPGTNEILMLILNETQNELFKVTILKFRTERTPAPALLVFTLPMAEMY
jgi:hypothetical protein